MSRLKSRLKLLDDGVTAGGQRAPASTTWKDKTWPKRWDVPTAARAWSMVLGCHDSMMSSEGWVSWL